MKKITLYNAKTGELRDYYGVPLSLLAISRFLHREGYQINIIEHFEIDLEKKLYESCKDSICLGFSCMTGHQIKDSLRIAKKIRKKFPRLPLVWGGWHPSILSEQTIENPYVDIVVRGQGEITFTELVHKLEKKQSLDNILGISFKKNGKIISNPDRPFEDLNKFPPLPYELVNVEKHLLNSEFGKRTINYYATQGCPFRCGFCADPQVYKRKWFSLSPENIVRDLKILKQKYKIDAVILVDSNFFINENSVREICQKLIDTKLNLKFGQVNGRSSILAKYDKKTWELMKRAGFVNILNGTESGSQEILDFITKDATVKDTIRLVELCKEYDITLVCSTFIGLPTKDVKKEFKVNINFINYLMKITDKNTYYVLIYTPYPGSPLYDLSLKQGFKAPNTLEKWADFELHNVNTPWVSKKYANLAEQLTIFYFPFLGNQLKEIVDHYDRFRLPAKILYYLVRSVVKIRWRLRFFALPIEYYLFRFTLYIKDKLRRK